MFKQLLVAIAASIVLLVSPVEAKVVQLDEDTVMLADELMANEGIIFRDIVRGMVASGEKEIQFLINTPGGSADAMMEIINDMKFWRRNNGVHWTTVNVGEAASAGGFIWLYGDVRQSIEYSRFMFHTAGVYSWFGLVPWENLSPEWREIVHQMNYELRQMLLDLLRDTELVNEFLAGGYGAQNWFTTYIMEQKGLIDQIL